MGLGYAAYRAKKRLSPGIQRVVDGGVKITAKATRRLRDREQINRQGEAWRNRLLRRFR